MKKEITTVFFDWDMTLAYTRTANNSIAERLAIMFELVDLPHDQEAIADALAQHEQDVADGRHTAIVRPQKRRDIARLYGRLFDYLGEEDKSWPVMERLYGAYAQLPTFLYDDSRPVLTQLAAQGYRLGIISNHSSSARAVMEELVGDLVPSRHIVISEELGVHKPAKTIYRRAAASVRCLPSHCLLVGDNLQVDAVGAVDSGNFACGIWLDRLDRGAGRSLPPATQRITSLDELPGLLAAL